METIALFTVAAVVGGVLLLHPRTLAVLAVLAVIFVRPLEHLTGLEGVGFIDDGSTILLFARGLFVRGGRGTRYPGIAFFLIFVLLGLASSAARGPEAWSVLVPGLFLACKAVMLGWGFSRVTWSAEDIRRLARGGVIVAVIIFASALANLSAVDPWASVFSASGRTEYRFGFPSLMGFFPHPFDLAFFASMFVAAALAYRSVFGASVRNTFMIALGSAVTVFTFRRKDLAGLLAVIGRFLLRSRRPSTIVFASMAAVLALVLTADAIVVSVSALADTYLYGGETQARTVLTWGSIGIAAVYFPLGAGFGRYGSRTAATEYSPEYVARGYEAIYGMGRGESGAFLTDVSWPAIIGETGFIGLASFGIFLLLLYRFARRVEQSATTSEQRFVGTLTVYWLILTLFQSVGAAVFSAPPMYGLLFAAAGLAVSLQRGSQTPLMRASHSRSR